MIGPWTRRLAISSGIALVLSLYVTGTGEAAAPVTYHCATVSPVFEVPPENLVIAQDCDGPLGTQQRVIINADQPPGGGYFCRTASAMTNPNGPGLTVFGHTCS